MSRAGLQRISVALAALLLCTACAASEAWVELQGERFTVEVADTRDKQTLGLMFRDHMDPDHGMLFVFQDEAPRSFWMKNTRIPLDMLFFDAKRKLVSVAENAKPCHTARCPNYTSAGPAKYVLELNAGTAAELDAQPGDQLVIHLK